jgi:hypothetical protein
MKRNNKKNIKFSHPNSRFNKIPKKTNWQKIPLDFRVKLWLSSKDMEFFCEIFLENWSHVPENGENGFGFVIRIWVHFFLSLGHYFLSNKTFH